MADVHDSSLQEDSQPSQFARFEGWHHLALSLHLLDEARNSCNGFDHDDSIINNDTVSPAVTHLRHQQEFCWPMHPAASSSIGLALLHPLLTTRKTKVLLFIAASIHTHLKV